MSSPSRSVAWLLLVASAAAVLVTGLVTTTTIVARAGLDLPHAGSALVASTLAATALTLASLGLRALRWVFLLRRSDVRIPIRDAYIGYLSGFSLLFAPLLLGEMLVRAHVLRSRAGVPPVRTIQVNAWERVCDALALTVLATMSAPRTFVAASTLMAIGLAWRATRTWSVALLASVMAWLLPGIGLWLLVDRAADFGMIDAQTSYAWSTLLGGLTLAPAGVVVTGPELVTRLQSAGSTPAAAVATVIALRVATVGISIALGLVMLATHLLTRRRATAGAHFDDIAHAYDAQIPAARRDALLEKKTSLMREVLTPRGQRGLDVGCGQGWYVHRMRVLGFDVDGIDASAGQVAIAAQHVGSLQIVRVGSALEIPAGDATYDFVYTINVLHHLPSLEHQRRAFDEIARVLRPGGVLFVHEINTRNPLFRFYMGYLFPTLNCIDEGVERWLLPHRLDRYTALPVRDIRYFTFLPDFLPQAIVRLLAPIERRLERSSLAPYSAHYMAVLEKTA